MPKILSLFLLIILFGYSYAILGSFEDNGIEWVTENGVVTDVWNSIYFSAQTFYSSSFGDIVPLGYSRLLVVVELIFSVILHVIVLGRIISGYDRK